MKKLALAVILSVTMAGPAMAYDNDRGHNKWNGHDRGYHKGQSKHYNKHYNKHAYYHPKPVAYYRQAPRMYYSHPVVAYYEPASAYYYPNPSLNFNFRF